MRTVRVIRCLGRLLGGLLVRVVGGLRVLGVVSGSVRLVRIVWSVGWLNVVWVVRVVRWSLSILRVRVVGRVGGLLGVVGRLVAVGVRAAGAAAAGRDAHVGAAVELLLVGTATHAGVALAVSPPAVAWEKAKEVQKKG